MAQSAVLPRILREVRQRRGLSQADVGRVAHLDHATVSDVERGRRRLARDAMPRLARALDDGFLALALAHEATAGAMPRPLDGPAIDQTLAACWLKTEQEEAEARAALREVAGLIPRKPETLTPEEQQRLWAALIERGEEIAAELTLIALACRQHGRSWAAFWQEVRQRQARRGEVQVA